MRTLSFILLIALFMTACQGSGSQENATSDETTAGEASPAQESAYTLTPFTPSAAFPDAAIKAVTYQDGKFSFDITGYELAVQTPDAESKMCANSGQGQHIHLIVDNAPYSAQYGAGFDYDIEDGEHYLLSFLSRSYHESVKNPGARYAKKITTENKSMTSTEDITQPMLFYSRPKGNYVGAAETEKVMLDFYLLNAELGANYKVKAEINGEEHLIDTWQPYYITGLPLGDNTIRLTLVDGAGNKVDTPLNPVERTFTLKSDPAEAQ